MKLTEWNDNLTIEYAQKALVNDVALHIDKNILPILEPDLIRVVKDYILSKHNSFIKYLILPRRANVNLMVWLDADVYVFSDRVINRVYEIFTPAMYKAQKDNVGLAVTGNSPPQVVPFLW